MGGLFLIDWLRRPAEDPAIEVAGRLLPIAVRRHPRAKRLTMRLAPDGSEVRVTLPKWCATRDALVFAHARAEWIERQLAAVPRSQPPAPGGTLRYRGEELVIAWHPAHGRTPRLDGDRLLVGGPAESLPARLQRWLEGEARALLAGDLAFYCARGTGAIAAACGAAGAAARTAHRSASTGGWSRRPIQCAARWSRTRWRI